MKKLFKIEGNTFLPPFPLGATVQMFQQLFGEHALNMLIFMTLPHIFTYSYFS